jgi:hypothetical protein
MIVGDKIFEYDPIFDALFEKSSPKKEYVSITASLCWLVFNCWATPHQLYVAFDLSNSEICARMSLQLIANVEKLTRVASKGHIRMRGKFAGSGGSPLAIHNDEKISVDEIERYRCFDLLIDGLRPGTGLAWPDYRTIESPVYRNSDSEAYHQVLVNKADLIKIFSEETLVASGGVEPKKKKGRPKGSTLYGDRDFPLLEEMAELLATGQAGSVHAAAASLADRAAGPATQASKISRLCGGYKERAEQLQLGKYRGGLFSN